MIALTFPADELTGPKADLDRAADFLELAAFFSGDSKALTSELANQADISAAEDYSDVDDEMTRGAEDLVSATVARIETRFHALGHCAYPYELDDSGNTLTCELAPDSLGHAAYVLSLVLSNLKALSPILVGSPMHPDQVEEPKIRQYFQYLATSGLAAEIQGSSWSFGFPRPDRSGFLDKLKEIWTVLSDGVVGPQRGAPAQPKDDQVDVFAARMHPDGLPGFLLAAAQVATGANARDKSLAGHLNAFVSRWFTRPPVTTFVPYMIVPFATRDDTFLDDVRYMGNVLHRLRLPRRVAEASKLVQAGHTVEAYDQLTEVAAWLTRYRERARPTA